MENNNKKITGKFGEELACEFLKKQGLKILERNYHYSRYSEIDIIAKDKDTIVFAEVKTRTNTKCGHPFEAITQQTIKNILKAGLYYLGTTKEKHKNYRIDIISVLGTDSPKIEYLKNISLN